MRTLAEMNAGIEAGYSFAIGTGSGRSPKLHLLMTSPTGRTSTLCASGTGDGFIKAGLDTDAVTCARCLNTLAKGGAR